MTFPVLLHLPKEDYAALESLRFALSSLTGKELTLEFVVQLCIAYVLSSCPSPTHS